MTTTPSTTDPGLLWGVHARFRGYLERLDDGRLEVSDGARIEDDQRIFFPAVEGEPGRFAGAVHFSGHHGMLAFTLARPRLSDGVLTVDDPFADAAPGARLGVVVVNETDGSTQLTEEGADLFLGTYPPGTSFDPLTVIPQWPTTMMQENPDDDRR